MRVGIAGPIETPAFSAYFPEDIIAAAPKGRDGTSVNQLALGLIEAGHQVTLISLDEVVKSREILEANNLRIVFGPFRHAKRARDFFRDERNFIREAIKMEPIDLIHAQWTYEYGIGALQSGKPALTTVHDWAPAVLKNNMNPGVFMRTLMNLYVFAKGRYFTAVSPYIDERVRRIPGKVCKMIPNAIADELFCGSARLGVPTPPTILSINNGFGYLKNVRTLLQAFPLMLRSLPSLHLQLAGSGFGPGGPAEQWARTQNLTRNVEFLGPQSYDVIHKLLAEAALLIHPSREESFGMTLLEAMAKRTPVIGGENSGAVPWVLAHGKAGVLINISRPEAIAAAAVRLLTDPVRWQGLSNDGFQHAFDNFRLSHVVEQYLATYGRVLDEHWDRVTP